MYFTHRLYIPFHTRVLCSTQSRCKYSLMVPATKQLPPIDSFECILAPIFGLKSTVPTENFVITPQLDAEKPTTTTFDQIPTTWYASSSALDLNSLTLSLMCSIEFSPTHIPKVEDNALWSAAPILLKHESIFGNSIVIATIPVGWVSDLNPMEQTTHRVEFGAYKDLQQSLLSVQEEQQREEEEQQFVGNHDDADDDEEEEEEQQQQENITTTPTHVVTLDHTSATIVYGGGHSFNYPYQADHMFPLDWSIMLSVNFFKDANAHITTPQHVFTTTTKNVTALEVSYHHFGFFGAKTTETTMTAAKRFDQQGTYQNLPWKFNTLEDYKRCSINGFTFTTTQGAGPLRLEFNTTQQDRYNFNALLSSNAKHWQIKCDDFPILYPNIMSTKSWEEFFSLPEDQQKAQHAVWKTTAFFSVTAVSAPNPTSYYTKQPLYPADVVAGVRIPINYTALLAKPVSATLHPNHPRLHPRGGALGPQLTPNITGAEHHRAFHCGMTVAYQFENDVSRLFNTFSVELLNILPIAVNITNDNGDGDEDDNNNNNNNNDVIMQRQITIHFTPRAASVTPEDDDRQASLPGFSMVVNMTNPDAIHAIISNTTTDGTAQQEQAIPISLIKDNAGSIHFNLQNLVGFPPLWITPRYRQLLDVTVMGVGDFAMMYDQDNLVDAGQCIFGWQERIGMPTIDVPPHNTWYKTTSVINYKPYRSNQVNTMSTQNIPLPRAIQTTTTRTTNNNNNNNNNNNKMNNILTRDININNKFITTLLQMSKGLRLIIENPTAAPLQQIQIESLHGGLFTLNRGFTRPYASNYQNLEKYWTWYRTRCGAGPDVTAQHDDCRLKYLNTLDKHSFAGITTGVQYETTLHPTVLTFKFDPLFTGTPKYIEIDLYGVQLTPQHTKPISPYTGQHVGPATTRLTHKMSFAVSIYSTAVVEEIYDFFSVGVINPDHISHMVFYNIAELADGRAPNTSNGTPAVHTTFSLLSTLSPSPTCPSGCQPAPGPTPGPSPNPYPPDDGDSSDSDEMSAGSVALLVFVIISVIALFIGTCIFCPERLCRDNRRRYYYDDDVGSCGDSSYSSRRGGWGHRRREPNGVDAALAVAGLIGAVAVAVATTEPTPPPQPPRGRPAPKPYPGYSINSPHGTHGTVVSTSTMQPLQPPQQPYAPPQLPTTAHGVAPPQNAQHHVPPAPAPPPPPPQPQHAPFQPYQQQPTAAPSHAAFQPYQAPYHQPSSSSSQQPSAPAYEDKKDLPPSYSFVAQ